jgi:hypothetical protein
VDAVLPETGQLNATNGFEKRASMALKRVLLGLSTASVVFALALPFLAAQPAQDVAAATDTSGNIHVPADYRQHYQFLGSWAVAADSGQGAKEMHVVYATPAAVAGYRSNKDFPDGTVLVKEVFETQTGAMTTGTVSHANRLKGWFVMVRDANNAHPDNPLWGDGWGWSWFDAGNLTTTSTKNYQTECRGCHIPAQATHWIYVNGYPVLRNADK